MPLTLLLDLDDTLLDSNMGTFIPAYFQALAKHMGNSVAADRMLPALMKGTELMLASEDSSRTLQEVFEAYFYPQLGVAKSQVESRIEEFYDDVFPSLGAVTRKVAGAAELVEWALAKGYRLAVATDPLFPRKAIYHRIRWAGLQPERFSLVSSFETFHFTKPHPAFFAEVLGRLGWQNGPVVMVGDDAERDLQPAQDLGLRTFHVADGASAASGTMGEGRGSLSDLRPWLESMDPAALEPDLQSPSAILAVLASTPAVLHSLTAGVPESCWPRKPGAQEWALVEVLCHLRDTEREIHQMQVETLLAENDPFIPRPDGSVWAKERNYLEEDGPSALRQFAAARMSTLARLQGLDGAVWTQKARHAIFGPTHFREVIGFMAEHDRMHVQQAWNILQTL